jgi:flagellar biosynthesis activator protein FlaF
MYRLAYSETVVDAPRESRAVEYDAIARSIQLMEDAQSAGMATVETIAALNYLRSLWGILIEDLAGAGNQLPPILRAQLISIGLSIQRQVEDVRLERNDNFAGLIEISRLIMDGLK